MTISINELSMTYKNGKRALRDVTLELAGPCFVGLLGPNGAGKTTLMKLLSAGLQPTKGRVSVDGVPFIKREREFLDKLGYLPQSFGLYNELTVWQFLDYMSALKGAPRNKPAIERVLRDTNLEGKKRIRTLSGGQRQRVGIAQALLSDPQALILDEPTAGLDPEERIRFRDLFSRMAQNRIVLLSTHIIDDVQSVCNQLIVINDGRILFTGAPSDLVSMAHGHVGVIEETGEIGDADSDGGYCSQTAGGDDRHTQKTGDGSYSTNAGDGAGVRVISRITTRNGVIRRITADALPTRAQPVEPNLEDAYIRLLQSQEVSA